MTREEIQADAETQVVPREVADRLAEALDFCNRYGSRNDTPDGISVSYYIDQALAEYRKAVPDAR